MQDTSGGGGGVGGGEPLSVLAADIHAYSAAIMAAGKNLSWKDVNFEITVGRCLCRRYRESTGEYVADGNSERLSVGVEDSCGLSGCYRLKEYAHGLFERCWTEQRSAAQEI